MPRKAGAHLRALKGVRGGKPPRHEGTNGTARGVKWVDLIWVKAIGWRRG